MEYGKSMANSNDFKSVLYVGGFVLPDKNAAAQRVIANAKIFEQLGYNVAFLNYSDEITAPRKTHYFGFECFEYSRSECTAASHMGINRVKEILVSRADISIVVAYNYPALAQMKLKKLCERREITCLGDITEWYRARDVPMIKRPVKFVDTFLRMRCFNSHLDGLIVISRYLKNYYAGKVPCVLLPPMVDSAAEKWQSLSSCGGDTMKLVYAGKPSKTKERLDVIVGAVQKASARVPVCLEVVGITKEEYCRMYGANVPIGNNVVFYGKLPHKEALSKVASASYSVVMRDDNRVTRAGFPTKFAESITCGTPVICNDNSDLKLWIDKYKCGFVVEEASLAESLVAIFKLPRPSVDTTLFDYRRYAQPMSDFLDEIAESE